MLLNMICNNVICAEVVGAGLQATNPPTAPAGLHFDNQVRLT